MSAIRYRDIERSLEDAIRAAMESQANARGEAGQETASADAPLALVAFDTPGIQDYVFRVQRPVDVRGGSGLVQTLTESSEGGETNLLDRVLAKHDLHPGCLVYAGGGRGLLVAPRHVAAAVASGVEGLLPRRTDGDLATFAAVLPVWPEDLSATAAEPVAEGLRAFLGEVQATTRYAATLATLFGRLARERSARTAPRAVIPAGARRCEACGINPPAPDKQACRACLSRRSFGARSRRDAEEVTTFADLGAEAMALIYADGANVGRAFQRLDSMARHRALSLAVEAVFAGAVEKAKASHADLRGPEGPLVQTPIRGGDDLVMIVPAQAAFDVARVLVEEVEKAFDLRRPGLLAEAFADAPADLAKLVDTFGLGVGIAVADTRFPLRFLLPYAKELQHAAKERIHRERAAGGSLRSAIDFLHLTAGNPLSQSIRELRGANQVVAPAGDEPGLVLTGKPYSPTELSALMAKAESLAAVASSQRHAVAREVLRGHALSRGFWRYQHARSGEAERAWAAFRGSQGASLDTVDGLLWRDVPAPAGRTAGDWKATDYLDLLEVLGIREYRLREETIRRDGEANP